MLHQSTWRSWTSCPGAGTRRDKLFRFIEELVQWKNSNNSEIIGTARRLILAATGNSGDAVRDS